MEAANGFTIKETVIPLEKGQNESNVQAEMRLQFNVPSLHRLCTARLCSFPKLKLNWYKTDHCECKE